MSIAAPIITFKAGICDLDTSANPPQVKPKSTPGYIYLYSEDDLIHFCWRPRSAALTDPELDLVMVPSDGTFTPYRSTQENTRAPTNGRIYVLKFSSSSQRYLFWLQSKSQNERDLAYFSPRDLKLGEIVNTLLQGEEVDVQTEIANLPSNESGGDDGDDDATMEDVEGSHHTSDHHGGHGSGGAGFDATGGDIREEGEESREGGADGGRAASAGQTDASSVIQGLLNSLQGGNQHTQSQSEEYLYTTLADLLSPSSTIPMIESADDDQVDNLLNFLPPALLLLAQNIDDIPASDINAETAQAVLLSLDLQQKRDILRRVLRSPQFTQSLGSLTVAIRDGGLPSISEALKVPVENGGFVRRGGVPLGGGVAVEAFMEGIRKQVTEKPSGSRGDTMETD
ncbi:uncharacterized protein BHQ10_001618 [Talaromyces amestolkiae]|uniref:Pru domain-containing protein n=1 Tax=Talaromyces amestolkiae TaxID=1196081 RepID=A0A364KPX2_TALAM|nr:uncharacterized protein BHQ10_001618 [Talaromyces amestolkiae]RAO65606.1 hypothetical protein BHQ10_001618 [Talaromyces amestolkiae]